MRQSIKHTYPTIFDDELARFITDYRVPANNNFLTIKTRNKNNWIVSPLTKASSNRGGLTRKLGGANLFAVLTAVCLSVFYLIAWYGG